MNAADALRVLRKLAAYQPSTRIDDMTPAAWAEALAPHDVDDALEAVTELATAPRRDGEPWTVELRDIVNACRRVESRREADRARHLEPPAEVADDPAAYKRWLIESARQLRARDYTPPPAIEAPARPVRSLLSQIAARADHR